MARVDVLSPDQIGDPELREMMQASYDEMYGIYGHCPESFKAFLQFYRPLKYEATRPVSLKELVRLRIAALDACSR